MAGYRQVRQYVHLSDELWTPITEEVVLLLNQAKLNSGMSWSLFARHVGIRERVIRRYRTSGKNAGSVKRHRRRVAIPMNHLDRILSFGGTAKRVEDFDWYTTDQLVERGVWQPMVNDGKPRRERSDERS